MVKIIQVLLLLLLLTKRGFEKYMILVHLTLL